MVGTLQTHLDVYRQLWTPLNDEFLKMERRGFGVDLEYLARQESKAQLDYAVTSVDLDREVKGTGWAGELNWNSPKQVQAFLFTPAGLNLEPSPVSRKGPADEGQQSTDATALTYLADHNPAHAELLRTELQRRKIKSSLKYLTKLQKVARLGPHGARVHCRIKRDTETGRQAVADPELQQIPADERKDPYDLRRAFVARPGHVLVVADFSQLEMRILAHLLLALFDEDSLSRDLEGDCHSKNALRVFAPLGRPYLVGVLPEQVKTHPDVRVSQCRDDIKAVIYGLNYGKGSRGFGASLRDEHGDPIGEVLAQRVIDGVFEIYPGLPMFHEWVRKFVRDHGYITTLLGRIRRLLDPRSNRAWRQALNTPMQGGGADIMDLAMLAVCRHPGIAALGGEPILPIHDEIVLEAPEEAGEEVGTMMKEAMENAYQLLVPLKADVHVGQTWAG